MFAGENMVTPADVTLSMIDSVTLDEAVPIMASMFSDSCRSAVWSAWLVVVSPESPRIGTIS